MRLRSLEVGMAERRWLKFDDAMVDVNEVVQVQKMDGRVRLFTRDGDRTIDVFTMDFEKLCNIVANASNGVSPDPRVDGQEEDGPAYRLYSASIDEVPSLTDKPHEVADYVTAREVVDMWTALKQDRDSLAVTAGRLRDEVAKLRSAGAEHRGIQFAPPTEGGVAVSVKIAPQGGTAYAETECPMSGTGGQHSGSYHDGLCCHWCGMSRHVAEPAEPEAEENQQNYGSDGSGGR